MSSEYKYRKETFGQFVTRRIRLLTEAVGQDPQVLQEQLIALGKAVVSRYETLEDEIQELQDERRKRQARDD